VAAAFLDRHKRAERVGLRRVARVAGPTSSPRAATRVCLAASKMAPRRANLPRGRDAKPRAPSDRGSRVTEGRLDLPHVIRGARSFVLLLVSRSSIRKMCLLGRGWESSVGEHFRGGALATPSASRVMTTTFEHSAAHTTPTGRSVDAQFGGGRERGLGVQYAHVATSPRVADDLPTRESECDGRCGDAAPSLSKKEEWSARRMGTRRTDHAPARAHYGDGAHRDGECCGSAAAPRC
jgi:hypothetical protein